MTFKDIKTNHPVFIFDKKNFVLKQGKVTAVSPHLNVGGMNTMTGNGQPMVDVTVETDGKLAAYTIPENLSVTYANDIVLSTAQEGLSAEVERAVNEAKQGLQKVDYYKMIIERAPDMLAQLNPQYKEKQETEKRFAKVETQISNLGSKIQQLLDKLG